MITVYHFILDHRIGGPHIYVRSLNQMLAKEIRSILITTKSNKSLEWSLINLRHIYKFLYPIEVIINVVRIFIKFKENYGNKNLIFDVHGAANLAPLIAARMLAIPTVWHIHETLNNYSPIVFLGKKLLNHKNSSCISVSLFGKKIFSLEDAIYIPGAVDVAYWNLPRPKKNGSGTLRLLAVGNINPLKGYDVLLKALEHVSFEFILTIVGAKLGTFNNYFLTLENQASLLNLKSGCSVEFVGWQSSDVVRNLMIDSDIFILPSRSEACPLALLEAMASGCASISTNVGDISNILSTPECGLIVEPDSPSEMTLAIEKMFEIGSDKRFNMGLVAKEKIVQNHSLVQMAQKHFEVYKKISIK